METAIIILLVLNVLVGIVAIVVALSAKKSGAATREKWLMTSAVPRASGAM